MSECEEETVSEEMVARASRAYWFGVNRKRQGRHKMQLRAALIAIAPDLTGAGYDRARHDLAESEWLGYLIRWVSDASVDPYCRSSAVNVLRQVPAEALRAAGVAVSAGDSSIHAS